MKISVNRY